VAGSAVHGFIAVGTFAGCYKLDAGAVCTVTASFATLLTVIHRIFLDVIAGAFTGGVTGVAPFIDSVEAGAAMGVTVRTAFQFQILNVSMGFGTVAVVTGSSTAVLCGTAADGNATLGDIIFGVHGRLHGFFGGNRGGVVRFSRLGGSLRRLCGFLRCQAGVVIGDFVRTGGDIGIGGNIRIGGRGRVLGTDGGIRGVGRGTYMDGRGCGADCRISVLALIAGNDEANCHSQHDRDSHQG
jgi:hypothetical protein